MIYFYVKVGLGTANSQMFTFLRGKAYNLSTLDCILNASTYPTTVVLANAQIADFDHVIYTLVTRFAYCN